MRRDDEEVSSETMSKRRRGVSTPRQRGERVVHGDKELVEKLGRDDPCPCGSGRRFKACCIASRRFHRPKALQKVGVPSMASYVVRNPEILGGTPTVTGTRVPAETVLAEVRAGTDRVEIFRNYPTLPPDAIEACLAWEAAGKPAVPPAAEPHVDVEITVFLAEAMLGVSASFMDRALAAGEIAFREDRGLRIVRADEVADYKRRIDAARERTLEELAAEAQRLGLGYGDVR